MDYKRIGGWWRNWINFDLDEVWYALWAAWFSNLDGGFEEMGRSFVGTIQSPVAGCRFPTSMSSALRKTLQSFLVKRTWQPLLHSCLMERREECARPGMTWASVAAFPRPGRLRLPTWVDWITSPSGRLIING